MATWIGTPNYTSGRGGNRVDHITLHIMAGYLAGTDSTFQDASRATSATYGIGADGTIHQYVRESDTPWSDSDWLSNQTGISIEHEGGLPQAACTRACMDASAKLCADIARRYGWTRLWHNGIMGNVYLHREIPGSTHTTCPDLAPNGLDVDYVIRKANEILSGQQEEEMVTDNDINKIVHAVWEYHWAGDHNKANMYDRINRLLALSENVNSILNPIKDKLRNVLDMLTRTDSDDTGAKDAAGKPLKSTLIRRLAWMDMRIRDMVPNPSRTNPQQTSFRLSDEDVRRIATAVKDML